VPPGQFDSHFDSRAVSDEFSPRWVYAFA